MSKLLLNCVAWTLLVCCASVSAQLLPDNKTLNVQSVERWMKTNRDIAPIVQVVGSLNTTDTALKAFEVLPPAEQDGKINEFLKSRDLLDSANRIVKKYGWKSVGEYMRLGAKLGNAIAAYFVFADLGKLTEEQEKQLKEKADPAVLAVPKSDIDFIKKNEKALQKYIKAYGAGH